MIRRSVDHLRGNAVAYIALFLALGLGTAWALDRNSVRSKHIVDGQVKHTDLADSVEGRVLRYSGPCGDGVFDSVAAGGFRFRAAADPGGFVPFVIEVTNLTDHAAEAHRVEVRGPDPTDDGEMEPGLTDLGSRLNFTAGGTLRRAITGLRNGRMLLRNRKRVTTFSYGAVTDADTNGCTVLGTISTYLD